MKVVQRGARLLNVLLLSGCVALEASAAAVGADSQPLGAATSVPHGWENALSRAMVAADHHLQPGAAYGACARACISDSRLGGDDEVCFDVVIDGVCQECKPGQLQMIQRDDSITQFMSWSIVACPWDEGTAEPKMGRALAARRRRWRRRWRKNRRSKKTKRWMRRNKKKSKQGNNKKNNSNKSKKSEDTKQDETSPRTGDTIPGAPTGGKKCTCDCKAQCKKKSENRANSATTTTATSDSSSSGGDGGVESGHDDGGGGGQGQQYKGKLTYYGGAGKGGHCTSDFVPPGFKTVAMNREQYDNGMACGSCVSFCFTKGGGGKDCFKAIVDNECPECERGDLDFGVSGDGKWPVEWHYIDCPTAPLTAETQGSNPWWLKLKIVGGPSGVKSMKCNGKKGQRTPDAFFVFEDGQGNLGCKLNCDIEFTNGVRERKQVCPEEL